MSFGEGHPALDKNTVFRRTFRFLLFPQGNIDFRNWVKKATIHYYENTIKMEIYDYGDTDEWIEQVQKTPQTMHLIMMDGCGQVLSGLRLAECYGVEHSVDFDYEKSDVLTHVLTMKYKKMTRNTGKAAMKMLSQ